MKLEKTNFHKTETNYKLRRQLAFATYFFTKRNQFRTKFFLSFVDGLFLFSQDIDRKASITKKKITNLLTSLQKKKKITVVIVLSIEQIHRLHTFIPQNILQSIKSRDWL